MKNKLFIFMCIVAAAVIRLYKIGLIKCIAPDGVAYIAAAKDLAAGYGFNPIWPPLYPWFISIFLKFNINSELCGQIVSVVFGTALVAVLYICASRIFPAPISVIVTALAVIHPFLVRYSAEVLSDSVFTFLITAVVFIGWFAISKQSALLFISCGLLSALAYLTKPEGIFLIVIASFWWFFGTKMSWTKKISALLVALIVLGAIILPYLYSIKKTTGQWKISQKENVVFSTALMAEGYESEYLDVSPLQYAKDNPIMFLKKTAKSLMKLLSRIPDACHPLIFVFLIIGLLSGVREKRFLLYAMSFLLFYFAGYAIFHPGRRYLVGWVPIIMFIPAYGMVFLSKSRVNMLRIIIVVSMLIILPKTFEIIREDGEGWKIAGEWIKNNYGSNKNILFEDGRVIYYADGKGISTADSDVVDFTVTSVKRPEGGQVFETKSGVVVYSER